MKHLNTLLLLAPFSLFSQNYVILGNISNDNVYSSNQSNINVSFNLSNQINIRSNPVIYNTNVLRNNSRNIQVNTVAVFTNGTSTPRQAQAVVRRPVNRTVSQTRRSNSSNTRAVVQNVPKPATANTESNNVSNVKVSPLVSNVNNNNDINANINVQQAVANPVKNEVKQVAVQSAVQVQSGASKKVADNSTGGGISFPKISFGGGKGSKAKSSGASHHVKKNTFKKFWIKATRKAAAKHGGKKKHFILDKCAQWFR